MNDELRRTRLLAWMRGELEDDDLSMDEIRDLEQRTMKAIADKTLERPGVHVFPEHRTLQ